ncbi:MAG: orotidine-5'-phosphate decarboxylase [Desulfobacterales bacterium]|jgi:orotidine-5'-phosphate decarboxylase|nr:orotidine-5'-phosphate decarboxylase [Desulfobacterales bacterium]
MNHFTIRRPEDYIVFPLDVASEIEAKRLVEMLSGEVGMFKVGLELFIRCGPGIVRLIHSAGPAGVFLDLKLHDIPATVGRSMAAAADLGVRLATVHCGESPGMLAAAVAAAAGRVGVLGVTVLTSVTAADLAAAGLREELAGDPQRLVRRRAQMALAAGCAGVVCSGREAAMIKAEFGPGCLIVTPGIRPSWAGSGTDDQRRVATPAEAVRAGSDYLVIGRPIRDAADPRDAARRTAAEIAAALQPSA